MKFAPIAAVLAAAAVLTAGCSSSGGSSAGPKPWQSGIGGQSLQQPQQAAPGSPESRREYIGALRDAGIFIPDDAEQAAAEAGEVMCESMARGATRRDLLDVVNEAMTGLYTRSERETLVDVSMSMCFVQVG